MSVFSFEPRRVLRNEESGPEYVVPQSQLRRVLAFTGRSIDDVINNPVARNQVRRYYKLSRYIDRGIESVELRRQWQPLP